MAPPHILAHCWETLVSSVPDFFKNQTNSTKNENSSNDDSSNSVYCDHFYGPWPSPDSHSHLGGHANHAKMLDLPTGPALVFVKLRVNMVVLISILTSKDAAHIAIKLVHSILSVPTVTVAPSFLNGNNMKYKSRNSRSHPRQQRSLQIRN
jgi:hypothetical protein